MHQIYLDVSKLEPPQPMTEIITALAQLHDCQYLKVFHRREPFPLYAKLIDAGWCYHCECLAEHQFHIYIYRPIMQGKFDHAKQQGQL